MFWHILVNALCLGFNYSPEGGGRRAEWKRHAFRRGQAQSGSKEKENQKNNKAKRHFFYVALANILANKSYQVYISWFLLTADSSPTSDANSFEASNVEEVEAKVYHEYSAAQNYEGINKYANTKI